MNMTCQETFGSPDTQIDFVMMVKDRLQILTWSYHKEEINKTIWKPQYHQQGHPQKL